MVIWIYTEYEFGVLVKFNTLALWLSDEGGLYLAAPIEVTAIGNINCG